MSAASAVEVGATEHTTSRRRLPVRRPSRWVVLAAVVYLGSALYLTWPMPIHIRSQLYGQGGDAFGTIGLQQLADHAGLVPFLPGTIPSIGAPEGRLWDYPLSIATLVVTAPRWILSLTFGVVVAWNLWVLVGYLLSALSIFLLVRRLTRSPPAALIAGWAFAFFPFADIRGGAHVDFMHTWPLVILLWRLLELRASSTRRNGLLVAAALGLCVLFNPYFWLFAAVVVGGVLIVDAVAAVRAREVLVRAKSWAWALGPPLLLLALLEAINLTYSGTAGVPSNGLSDALLYSARPLDYLIPIPGSGLLPSGDFASEYARGVAVGERGLYVGWSVIALALAGLVVTLRGRGLTRSGRGEVLIVGLIGLLALVFSAVPVFTIAGHTIHLPSYYVVQLSGAWRVFARFVILVMLALCVLMGTAIAHFTRGRRAWIAAPVLIAVSCLVVKDLWWKATPSTIAPPTNPIWQLVGRQHDGTIAAEYPLVVDVYSDYRYLLSEGVIHHRLLNGYMSHSTEEQRAMWLEPLTDPQTAPQLARLDVRWVMINETDNPPSAALLPGAPGRGFRFVSRAAGWSLWRVTARPAGAEAYPNANFSYPFGTPGALASWLTANAGTIRIEASGCAHGCDGMLRFLTSSFSIPHEATFSLDGRVLARVAVTTKNQPVSLPVHLTGPVTNVDVSVTPPGVSPQSVNGSPDPRDLSIDILEPTFTRRAGP